MTERLCFNECCFGWLLKDRTFEPIPMPWEWQFDARGAQIVSSRLRDYGLSPLSAVYARDAHYPSRAEQQEVVRAATPQLDWERLDRLDRERERSRLAGVKATPTPPMAGGELFMFALFWTFFGLVMLALSLAK